MSDFTLQRKLSPGESRLEHKTRYHLSHCRSITVCFFVASFSFIVVTHKYVHVSKYISAIGSVYMMSCVSMFSGLTI